MGLLSFLKRGGSNESDAGEGARAARGGRSGNAGAADDVQLLRVQARRRLIGSAVLVGVAIIVFPLLFETQPRPIPVDLPIDIPKKDSAPALNIPAVRGAAPTEGGQGRGIITETAEQAAADRALPPPADKPREVPVDPVVEAPVERKPEARAEVRPEPKPEPRATIAEPARAKPAPPEPKVARAEHKPEAKPERANESSRVQAMLDGRAAEKKPDAVANGARFIVQVGAYADSKAAQDARMKVERMGLKTYTQAVETADGKRIRVRVGPFNSRDEADKVAAKVRGGGLTSAVLTL